MVSGSLFPNVLHHHGHFCTRYGRNAQNYGRLPPARIPWWQNALVIHFTIIFLLLLSQTVQAYTTVHLAWDPNPSSQGVTHYTLTVDQRSSMDIPASKCSLMFCDVVIIVNARSWHSYELTASNATDTSLPAMLIHYKE
jgi:hypothetical protein